MKIAIIGAGLSGSTLYHFLKQQNHEVTLFEKSRGAGGRCSTRYINEKLCDHGTPFETTNKEFSQFCDGRIEQNILQKKENIYYPTKGINKLCSSMIEQDHLIKNTKIVSAKQIENKWLLIDQNGISYEGFDRLIITIPTPQILQMDIELPDGIKKDLSGVTYDSIATLMVYSYTLQNLISPKLIADDSFKKIVDNSSKYDYKNFSSYVIHLSEALTNTQNFQSKDEVESYMLKKVFDVSKIDLKEDFHIIPHFWKYAFVAKNIEKEYLYDENLSLGFCGDYFKNSNLEGAYLSAKKLYEDTF